MTIRRQPADFQVLEALTTAYLDRVLARPGGAASHALYRLTKSSMTTPEAVSRLAKSLDVRPGDIEYAGLKDKHAQTTQHVSVRAASPTQLEAMPASIGIDAPTPDEPRSSGTWLNAERLGFVDEPITAAAIERNRFVIVVRDLSRQASVEMDRRAGLLLVPDAGAAALLFVNYFGAQRFGSARHKQGFIARDLMAGDFDQALRLAIATPARKDTGKTRTFTRLAAARWGDWDYLAEHLPRCPERAPIEALARGEEPREAFTRLPAFLQQMYVEAYQSHLWNDTVRRFMAMLAEEREPSMTGQVTTAADGSRRVRAVRSPVLHTTDAFGDMLFVHPGVLQDPDLELEIPVFSPKTALIEPWARAAGQSLVAEGVRLEDLQIPGLRRPFFGEAMRRVFVRAQEFSLSEPEADELSPGARRCKRTVSFTLPRGSYATVVLRALGQ